MSVATNLHARQPVPVPRRRAVLTVVPAREVAAPRAPFVVAVVSLLVAGLIGLLVLNTVLGKDSFHLHELRGENRALLDQEQALVREVEALRSPATIAEKALAMGMVPAGPPAFLRLPDGAVLGSAEPAEPPVPVESVDGAAASAGETSSETSSDSDEPAPSESTDDE